MTKALPAKVSFGDLLHHILVAEKRQPLKPVADALGVSVRGFCSRLRNGGRLDPDEVATLLCMVADERLPQWFFADSGLGLVRQAVASPGGAGTALRRRLAACAVDAVAAICDLADAPAQDGAQQPMMERHLDHAEGALLSIRLPSVDGSCNGGGGGKKFAGVVNLVLLAEKSVRPQALAEALNMSYQTLHARVSGQVAFLPGELRQLFRTFPDPRLADCLLAGTPYLAILRPPAAEPRSDGVPTPSALRDTVEALEASLHAQGAGDAALPAAAAYCLDQALRQLAALRWSKGVAPCLPG